MTSGSFGVASPRIGEERLVIGRGVLLLADAFLGTGEPVWQGRKVSQRRRIVEKDRRRLAAAPLAGLEFGERLCEVGLPRLGVRDAEREMRQPHVEQFDGGAVRINRVGQLVRRAAQGRLR